MRRVVVKALITVWLQVRVLPGPPLFLKGLRFRIVPKEGDATVYAATTGPNGRFVGHSSARLSPTAMRAGDVRKPARGMSTNELCSSSPTPSPCGLLTANTNAGAPEAVCAVGRPYDGCATVAIAVAAMDADCAVWTDASRPVGTGRAGRGVGFGDLNSEQAEN
jgi:hypothetical protein